MRHRFAVLVKVDEDQFFYGKDRLAGELVAHLAAQGQGRAAEFGGGDADLDDVALPGGGDEVDLRNEFGDDVRIVELNDRVQRRFFVDPLQQAAAEEGAVGVKVLGFDPFAGVKADCVGHFLLIYCHHHLAHRLPALQAAQGFG